MEDLRIVMFPHPAAEYVPGKEGEIMIPMPCGWNNSGHHCRRLLMSNGSYVEKAGRNEKLKSGKIAFWGEWEANTQCSRLPSLQSDLPFARWFHEPTYPTVCPPKVKCRGECRDKCVRNTDPCVFGTSFKYALCRQIRKTKGGKGNATQMQKLAPGSLVVFCGKIGGHFYLDTVFVVGHRYDYVGPDKNRAVKCSNAYRILTLNQTSGKLSFYRGRTYSARDIYSFSPGYVVASNNISCLNARKRCRIYFDKLNKIIDKAGGRGIFNERNGRHFSSMKADDVLIRKVWEELLSQITSSRNGFVPAVHFDWPE